MILLYELLIEYNSPGNFTGLLRNRKVLQNGTQATAP